MMKLSLFMKISKLLETNKTIFKAKEIGFILGVENKDYLKVILNRAKKNGEIFKIRKGIYSLKREFDIYELANKLKTPSYISLETVLQKEGVIFQDYSESVFSVSNNTVEKKVNDFNYKYFKIKDEVLSNMMEIKRKNNYLIASKERALCDKLYLSPGFYFDNLRGINWDKIKEIVKIYENKRLEKEIEDLFQYSLSLKS